MKWLEDQLPYWDILNVPSVYTSSYPRPTELPDSAYFVLFAQLLQHGDRSTNEFPELKNKLII